LKGLCKTSAATTLGRRQATPCTQIASAWSAQAHENEGRVAVIELKVEMDVRPEKLRELEQTLLLFAADMRGEPGCQQADLHREVQDEHRYCLIAGWENREHLDAYLQSERCGALLGTKILLKAPPKITVDEVVRREGMGAVATARAGPKSDGAP
jgi:quinol monooxygenase YgiN